MCELFTCLVGLRRSLATAYGFERQAVRRGLPLYEDLREKIRSLPVVHADETSWCHDGHQYWVWYAGDDDLAFFHLDEHRSSEAAQSLFGQRFGGTIVADAYASYKGVHPKDWQSCLAHIKTKAKELGQELAVLKGRAADPLARQSSQDVQGFVRTACQAPHRLSRGPWRYHGIGFSKHGSLTATIDHLVGRSPAGLSASELTQKLQHPCHAVLSQLHKAGRLDRLRLSGTAPGLQNPAPNGSEPGAGLLYRA